MILSDMPGESGRTALYRLYDDHDTLLYVGIVSNPQNRWADHARDKRDTWWPEVSMKEVVWFNSREDAAEAEVATILAERPRHNAVGSLRNEHGAQVRDGMARKRLLIQLAAKNPVTYRVAARRSTDYWVLEVPALPEVQTRARTLTAAERDIRQQIAQALDREPTPSRSDSSCRSCPGRCGRRFGRWTPHSVRPRPPSKHRGRRRR